MININDARIDFMGTRVEEIWSKTNEVKQYKNQREVISKIVATLKEMLPEDKGLIGKLSDEYSLLFAYTSDIFYAAGLLDGMKMPEYLAEACKESMLLQVQTG